MDVIKEIQEMKQLINVKTMSDASAAIRESYRPTNKVLGEGTYGKVFLFKSRGVEPEKDYAVKVMLK